MPITKWGALSFLLAILLPAGILLANIIYVTFDEGFYHKLLEKHNSYSRFDNRETVDTTISGLIAFFTGKDSVPPAIFDDNERSHLVDVKVLLDKVRLFLGVVTLLFAFYLTSTFLSPVEKRARLLALGRTLMLGGGLTLLLIAALVIAAVNFSPFFRLFHEMFFPQGNWSFPMESTLIRLFPWEFFFDLTVAVIARTALVGLLCLIGGYLLRRWIQSSL